MFCIVTIENDSKIANAVFQKFCKSFDIIYFNNSRIMRSGKGQKILLINSKQMICSQLPAITVFAPDFDMNLNGNISGVSIVSSENKNQLFELSKTKSPVITCGLCEKDTFTCTSLNDNTAVIAMQRTIFDLNGNAHLPFEIPVDINSCEELFCKMALKAISTLLGEID